MEDQLLLLERAPQPQLDLQLAHRGAFHRAVEEQAGARALALGVVHGGLGALQQRVLAAAVSGRHHDADAGGQVELLLLDGERAGHGLEQPARHPLDGRAVCCVAQQDHELVAAQARDRSAGVVVAAVAGQLVARAQAAPQPFADLPQQLVAVLAAERLVDLLEAVDVQEQHGDLFAVALGTRQGQPQEVGEQRAVGQAGEVVVVLEPQHGVAGVERLALGLLEREAVLAQLVEQPPGAQAAGEPVGQQGPGDRWRHDVGGAGFEGVFDGARVAVGEQHEDRQLGALAAAAHLAAQRQAVAAGRVVEQDGVGGLGAQPGKQLAQRFGRSGPETGAAQRGVG